MEIKQVLQFWQLNTVVLSTSNVFDQQLRASEHKHVLRRIFISIFIVCVCGASSLARLICFHVRDDLCGLSKSFLRISSGETYATRVASKCQTNKYWLGQHSSTLILTNFVFFLLFVLLALHRIWAHDACDTATPVICVVCCVCFDGFRHSCDSRPEFKRRKNPRTMNHFS